MVKTKGLCADKRFKCLYGIGFATHKEIDELNILNATFLAMQRALVKIETFSFWNKYNLQKEFSDYFDIVYDSIIIKQEF